MVDVNVTMTMNQALKLGIIKCASCGLPPNNHFMDQPGKPCAHDKSCTGYVPKIYLPKDAP